MANRSGITEEIRQAVIAELITGAKVNATARKYHLSPATVSRLRADMTGPRLKQIETEKRERIDDLLLICVASHVRGMKQIVETISTPEYLKAQDASAIADIYREVSNTTLSILEAASSAGIDSDPERAVPE